MSVCVPGGHPEAKSSNQEILQRVPSNFHQMNLNQDYTSSGKTLTHQLQRLREIVNGLQRGTRGMVIDIIKLCGGVQVNLQVALAGTDRRNIQMKTF